MTSHQKKKKIKKTINLFEPHFKREKGTGRPTKKDRRQMEKYVDKFKKSIKEDKYILNILVTKKNEIYFKYTIIIFFKIFTKIIG